LLNAVGLNVGAAIPANAVSPDLLKARVAALLV
jgi:hypothetical protein